MRRTPKPMIRTKNGAMRPRRDLPIREICRSFLALHLSVPEEIFGACPRLLHTRDSSPS